MIDRYAIRDIRATTLGGRFSFFGIAWWALLHPRPVATFSIPTVRGGRESIGFEAATLGHIATLLGAAARHAIRGESQVVTNHGVWQIGATATPHGEQWLVWLRGEAPT